MLYRLGLLHRNRSYFAFLAVVDFVWGNTRGLRKVLQASSIQRGLQVCTIQTANTTSGDLHDTVLTISANKLGLLLTPIYFF